ncbi:AraC family transcriptional regulator [Phyllobacterium phragmitis]|uniref:AraC family transcriptional regulator n=1 Tax=Phyllobacterium phragmitis TaxID=2670329 RepID=A0A2S9IRG0_9HYPH|nr:AraC family transcriptional regulator [Phyllobacterium phragmitis]PRD43110.1 AraC family transcriptional regulator [Phyllobacterium phragmitis]
MADHGLVSSITAVTKILGSAPPIIPEIFNGGTRLTGRYVNVPFDTYIPAMKEHVLVAHYSGGGHTWAKIDGKRLMYPTFPGRITFVPRGHDSERSTSAPFKVSNTFLSQDRLVECANQLNYSRVPDLIDRQNFSDPKLFTLLNLLCEEVESREAASRLFIEQLLDLICIQLLRGHSVSSLPNFSAHVGLAPWQAQRVLDYMRDNLDRDIGLQELADLTNLSRSHFCGAFRKATGRTPHQWLMKLRIQAARQLLACSALPIVEIALNVGYQTHSAFSVAFRRSVGVTPQEYRRLYSRS